MSVDRTPSELLVTRLLEQQAALSMATAPTAHPDDDALALFAEGRLPESEQRPMVDHLADCADCRAKAALLLVAFEGADVAESVRPTIPVVTLRRRWPMQVLALAAGLLICVGVYAFFGQPETRLADAETFDTASELLAQGNFESAKAQLDKARANGIDSPRLDSLTAQTLRRIPNAVALASFGKLTDLGIGIGGIVAREPASTSSAKDIERAQQLLDAAASADFEAALNRGHLLLTLNQNDAALEQFQELVTQHPDRPLAWLGKGNAHFILGEYQPADEAYRSCLSLAPDMLAAKLNLAMTLEEQEDWAAAREQWQSLLAEHSAALSDDERRQIESQIRTLQESAP
jgi:tetratricopeptide (TPR) repeat protein